MSDEFRTIPEVGTAAYLRVLELAVDHAARDEGVHTSGFRWYRDPDAEHYLDGLRDKPVAVRTRLLLVDDAEREALHDGLADDDVTACCWRRTGDVDTFLDEHRRLPPDVPGARLPRGCALDDRQLFVTYDVRGLSLRHAPTLRRVAPPA